MDTYECEKCGTTVEIETYEAFFGHHEHYESSLCLGCFNLLCTSDITKDKEKEFSRL